MLLSPFQTNKAACNQFNNERVQAANVICEFFKNYQNSLDFFL
jgi:hypothetical protein